MKRLIQLTAAAVLCFASAALAPHASAAGPTLPSDGWASWQVPAVDDAPDWCCWRDWNSGSPAREPCRLDSRREGYSSRGETTDSIRVYARFAGGKIERLRALSATCPVKTDTEIRDLGAVPVDDSARWLATFVKQSGVDAVMRHRIGDDALAALGIHRGTIALDTLTDIARNDASDQRRKRAVFWLAILRGREGAEVATSVMFGDSDADVREHAAFAVSRSESPQAAADLIRLATTDPNAGVRSQGWFWLAQSGSAATEDAIGGALQKEADRRVRERAIFALSRLPEERATRALIAVAEDRSLSSQERKRAVFWLSRSDASAAQAYLEKVLTQVTSRL